MDFTVILLLVEAVLLFILALGYHNYAAAVRVFESTVQKYQDSYIDMAGAVDTIAGSEKLTQREIVVIRTVLSIHSEALNVKMILDLFKEVDDLRKQK